MALLKVNAAWVATLTARSAVEKWTPTADHGPGQKLRGLPSSWSTSLYLRKFPFRSHATG